ncbi:hypothetical protein [Psittacicella gerlachiana]|uniref:Uncharacterized protein n=1 Tax=Psittacicella gerlachiana TaxID=2028574 RepID=A0A3A1Y3U5_9GAMM|nr:hypothetical protein [Psittacicella gerlachiana]RIY32121.1 hypothetical protein CKF59_07175 [Psittacicella gerlachiana]
MSAVSFFHKFALVSVAIIGASLSLAAISVNKEANSFVAYHHVPASYNLTLEQEQIAKVNLNFNQAE